MDASTTAADVYEHVRDKEAQGDFKLVFKRQEWPEDHSRVVDLVDGDYVANVQVIGRRGLKGGMKKAGTTFQRPDMREYPEFNKLLALYILKGRRGVRRYLRYFGDLDEHIEDILIGVENIVSTMSTVEKDILVDECAMQYQDKYEVVPHQRVRRMIRAARKFAPKESPPKESPRAQRSARNSFRAQRREWLSRNEVPAPYAAPAPVAAPAPAVESPSQRLNGLMSMIQSFVVEHNELDMKKSSADLADLITSVPGMEEKAFALFAARLKKDKATHLNKLRDIFQGVPDQVAAVVDDMIAAAARQFDESAQAIAEFEEMLRQDIAERRWMQQGGGFFSPHDAQCVKEHTRRLKVWGKTYYGRCKTGQVKFAAFLEFMAEKDVDMPIDDEYNITLDLVLEAEFEREYNAQLFVRSRQCAKEASRVAIEGA
jgi:hypothetical protein